MALINISIPGLPVVTIPGLISINGAKMQLKKTFPLDNLPLDIPNVIYSALNTNSPSGFLLGPANGGSLPNTNWYLSTVTSMGGRRWIKGTNNLNCLAFAMSQMGLAMTGKVVFGFRMITGTVAASRTGSFYNSSTQAIYDSIGDGTGSNPLLLPNTEHYIEAVIDFADSTYRRYVDGKLHANTVYTFNASQIAAIKIGYWWIGAYTGAADNWYIRDVHVREYAPGETYTPFADVVVTRHGITASTGSDWAASDGGTIQNAFATDWKDLSVNQYSGSQVAPFAEASKGSAAAPLVLTLGAHGEIDGTILGSEIIGSVKSMDGAAAALTPKFTYNSTDLALLKQTLQASYQWRKSFGLTSLMPDGSVMTSAKLVGMTLTLTPSAS